MAAVMPKWQSWVAATRPCGQQSLEYLLSSPLLKGWPIPNLKRHSPGAQGASGPPGGGGLPPQGPALPGRVIVLSPADLPACHTVRATDSKQEWNWEGVLCVWVPALGSSPEASGLRVDEWGASGGRLPNLLEGLGTPGLMSTPRLLHHLLVFKRSMNPGSLAHQRAGGRGLSLGREHRAEAGCSRSPRNWCQETLPHLSNATTKVWRRPRPGGAAGPSAPPPQLAVTLATVQSPGAFRRSESKRVSWGGVLGFRGPSQPTSLL